MIFKMMIASVVLMMATGTARASEWQQLSDENGITVYQKNEQGDGISLKGETVIAARLDDIINVMKENSTAHLWMPMVAERRDLYEISNTERIEYTHIAMPWPVSDRYFINRAKATRLDNGQMRVFVQSIDDPDPKYFEADKVLGFLHYSEIMLTPVNNGNGTHITVEINSDPRGLIPKFLVHMAQRAWPVDFFNGLIRILEKAGSIQTQNMAH